MLRLCLLCKQIILTLKCNLNMSLIKRIVMENSKLLTCVNFSKRMHRQVPIVDFYHRTTGELLSKDKFSSLSKKHPNIDKLSHERIQCTLQILQKFNISPLEACLNLHVFSMNPISMDNYGEILKECGFIAINAKSIIKYHTIAKTKTIAVLKKAGLIREDMELEEALLNCLNEWPDKDKELIKFSDSTTTLLIIRTSVLERYLKWRLAITTEDFQKYCRNYLPLRHRPFADIQEALNIAEKEIKFNIQSIRRNGFIISSDPVNTKLILNNVTQLAGMDIKEAIRIEPAILKNNYNALLQIRDILESYRIPNDAQAVSLKVFCMRPDTVKERLNELSKLKEFQILSSNPRVLSMVVHQKKLINRLNKIQAAKKQCYSLNKLISSNQIFNNYITSFGSKACGRDIATLVNSSLHTNETKDVTKKDALKLVVNSLRKHKYWLHVALDIVDDNLRSLKGRFDDQVIFENCQLLLYPMSEVNRYTDILLKMRQGEPQGSLDTNYTHLNQHKLTDSQILSLVLYEIEKKYHFSGDGIWADTDKGKLESQANL